MRTSTMQDDIQADMNGPAISFINYPSSKYGLPQTQGVADNTIH